MIIPYKDLNLVLPQIHIYNFEIKKEQKTIDQNLL